MNNLINPFQKNGNRIIHIFSKHVLDKNAANSVREATKIDKAQFEKFFVKKIYNVTPGQCMIQLKTNFRYF